ncbi:MAG: AraC family transcriptional regulator [Ruminococcaceae bacterium]|nr:AraC family transcriptional regulator [Oscillospiraceae bacterium]
MNPEMEYGKGYLLTESCIGEFWESNQSLMVYEHTHLHYELLFIFTPSRLRHTYGGQIIETDTPCIILHPPYALHSTNTLDDEPYRRFKVDFHPCMLTEYGGICSLGRLAEYGNCIFPVTEADLAAIKPLLLRLEKAEKAPMRTKAALLSLILSETEALAPAELPVPTQVPAYIQQVLHYVVENIGDSLDTEMLAQKFFVSPSKLSRDFRTATSLSVHEYITAMRIAHAKLWLNEGVSVAQIAQQCGFSQEAAFIRMFRQKCGITPGEYRREN